VIGDTEAVEIGVRNVRVCRGDIPGGRWEIDMRSGDVPLRLVLDDRGLQELLEPVLAHFFEMPEAAQSPHVRKYLRVPLAQP
jgi:hypothetical protein